MKLNKSNILRAIEAGKVVCGEEVTDVSMLAELDGQMEKPFLDVVGDEPFAIAFIYPHWYMRHQTGKWTSLKSLEDNRAGFSPECIAICNEAQHRYSFSEANISAILPHPIELDMVSVFFSINYPGGIKRPFVRTYCLNDATDADELMRNLFLLGFDLSVPIDKQPGVSFVLDEGSEVGIPCVALFTEDGDHCVERLHITKIRVEEFRKFVKETKRKMARETFQEFNRRKASRRKRKSW